MFVCHHLYCNIFFDKPAQDIKEFIRLINNYQDLAKDFGLDIGFSLVTKLNLTNLSKNSFKMMSPSAVPDKVINKIASRNMLESSWIGGFPFSSSGFNDEVNYYFAKDIQTGRRERYCHECS